MIGYGILGNGNILYTTGGARGFGKIYRLSFPKYIMAALLNFFYIWFKSFIIPDRDCFPISINTGYFIKSVIFAKISHFSGFDQLLKNQILVFNGCYHGSVDETMVRLVDGKPVNRPGLAGEFRDLTEATKVVEFNDIPALEKALAGRDVACVITEPVLTNCCMVLPAPGFHDALRRLTRKAGTLLLIDETHTISTGPGGYTRRFGLEPDLFVLGKPIAGGVPASVWGMSAELAKRYRAYVSTKEPGYSGMGTTLSANPLQFAAMRATLEEVMTEANYAHMERLAQHLASGLAAAITAHGLPWHVARVGARVEFICAKGPLKNGGEAETAHAPGLEAAIHVALVNRGVLIAPFHNMMLVSPATTKRQVDRLVAAFGEVAEKLTA